MSMGADLMVEMEIEYELWLNDMAQELNYRCSLINSGIWQTASGKQIRITDMSLFHLSNTVAMLKRWLDNPSSEWIELFADCAYPALNAELNRRRQGFFTKVNVGDT